MVLINIETKNNSMLNFFDPKSEKMVYKDFVPILAGNRIIDKGNMAIF